MGEKPDSYTPLEMEAALCAWEWMLEQRDDPLLIGYFEEIGTSGMRHVSMQAGQIALQTYDLMQGEKNYEFSGAYDWEFIPDVLRLLTWSDLIRDNQYNGPPYEPNIDEILTVLISRDKALRTPEARLFYPRTVDSPDVKPHPTYPRAHNSR